MQRRWRDSSHVKQQIEAHGGEDKLIKVWDAVTGAKLHTFDVYSVCSHFKETIQVIHPPLWHIAQMEQDLCKWKQCSTLLIVLKLEKGGFLVDGIKWNCTKILVDKEGKVLEFEPGIQTLVIEKSLALHHNNQELNKGMHGDLGDPLVGTYKWFTRI
ncbi:hypothetical protein L1987_63818 [Smallanthus sonchifolius]|uniref:Uncharacterized protein n=1 Tax=Smallanthus sonchifolius TaxID=185202 RepID=A0ACB9CEQ4_9ASTR|nr:hypothetical protein L1987_63818 [Smallanthus sonchifolius]